MHSSRVQEGLPEQIDFDVFGMIVLVIGALTAKLSQPGGGDRAGPGWAGPGTVCLQCCSVGPELASGVPPSGTTFSLEQ